MRDKIIAVCIAQCGEAEQPRVIAELRGEIGLATGLSRAARQPRDHRGRATRPIGGGLARELQHRLVEPRLADGELGGVNADRKPAGARVEIVAGQGLLPARVEACGGRRAPADAPGSRGRIVCPRGHRREDRRRARRGSSVSTVSLKLRGPWPAVNRLSFTLDATGAAFYCGIVSKRVDYVEDKAIENP